MMRNLQLLFVIAVLRATSAAIVEPLQFPDPTQTHFEFHLNVENRASMVAFSDKAYRGPVLGAPMFLYYNPLNESFTTKSTDFADPCSKTPVTAETVVNAARDRRFVFGDGTHRKLITINGQMPGPALVVNEGAEVVVHVKNNLFMEVITLHFHGLRQLGTWWMDGVPGLQQCAITPGSTFVYRFLADKAGTYWYHGHFGTDHSDGLMGAFIVVPKNETKCNSKQSSYISLSNGNVITTAGQHVIMVQEWFEQTATDSYFSTKFWTLKVPEMLNSGSANKEKCFSFTGTYDGTGSSPVPVQSVLLNGNGWHNYTDQELHPWRLPLDTYHLKENKAYLFRLINSGIQLPFKVSVEGHKLHVVATDGRPIQEVSVDSLVISPGERYDFLIVADQKPGTYYLKAETLEIHNFFFKNITLTEKHYGLARIQYEGAPVERRRASSACSNSPCTAQLPCRVLNCPFKLFRRDLNTTCVHLTELKNFEPTENPELLGSSYADHFEEHFLNLMSFDRINGWRFMHPHASPYLHPHNETEALMPCKRNRCRLDDDCSCTFHLNVSTGNTVQLVIYNQRLNPREGASHPMHIHGHHFLVMKQGWGAYDLTTGYVVDENRDLECHGSAPCFDNAWVNASWNNGNIPGLNLDRPILKDTVTVPVGAYVVLRYKSDNPGWWMMHCHINLHSAIGMALVIREGNNDEMSRPPASVGYCGHIDPVQLRAVHTNEISINPLPVPALIGIVIGCLLGGSLVGSFIVFLCFVPCRRLKMVHVARRPTSKYEQFH